MTRHLKSCPIGSDNNKHEKSQIGQLNYADGWDQDLGYDFSLDNDRRLHGVLFG